MAVASSAGLFELASWSVSSLPIIIKITLYIEWKSVQKNNKQNSRNPEKG